MPYLGWKLILDKQLLVDAYPLGSVPSSQCEWLLPASLQMHTSDVHTQVMNMEALWLLRIPNGALAFCEAEGLGTLYAKLLGWGMWCGGNIMYLEAQEHSWKDNVDGLPLEAYLEIAGKSNGVGQYCTKIQVEKGK